MMSLTSKQVARRQPRVCAWVARIAAALAAVSAINGATAGDLDQTGTLWAPYLEWSLDNPSFEGNPFDLVATVTFEHQGTGETRTTEMFYDNGTTWKFRFAGTRTGLWAFTTSSDDPELDGHTGQVTIEPNPNPTIKGFLASDGNKYVRRINAAGDLEAYRLNVYMNDHNFDEFIAGENYADPVVAEAYLQEAGELGFDCVFTYVVNSWFEFGTKAWNEHDSEDPDPQTFETLESMITTIHGLGGRLQIWAWGDEARRWTPIGVGGINGIPDKRLQRYIAARLGPIPGWSMGYGFDLQEWVTEEQVEEWAAYMHAHLGWQHLLWARGRSNSELDVVSYSGSGPNTYQDVVNALESDPSRPHLYEERFTYMRWDKYDMETTRRHQWWYAMAGGMGSWWGFFSFSPYPYPNPEQLLTCGMFWTDRFCMDMDRANDLTDGYCLKAADNTRYVFYKEDATSIEMNLGGMNGLQPAMAVDTKTDYTEIPLGQLNPEAQTWTAPYSSDWAIAVGGFGLPPDETPPTTPAILDAVAASESRIDLTWTEAEDPDTGISGYMIYRDDLLVASVPPTPLSHSDTGLDEQTEYTYEVSAVNGGGLEGARSDPVSVTTLADTTPPTIVSVTAAGGPHVVTIVFSEPVTEESAQAIENYTIDYDVTVTNAALDPDTITVTLTTSTLAEGVIYTLTVNDVRDCSIAGNVIEPDSQVEFTFVSRVNDGLVVLYDFAESEGTTVHDVSGVGTPLNLELADPGAAEWVEGGLSITNSTIVQSAAAATKIIDACMASNEITIEAWIVPANTSQTGPARIVTLSANTSVRNFTLGQSSTAYDVRLRTTETSNNGIPSLTSPAGTATTELTHFVYTRGETGQRTIYVDNAECASGSIGGDFSNWDTGYRFALANELTLDRTWLGEFRLVAIYDRALEPAEVAQNFDAGPDGPGLTGDLDGDGDVDIDDFNTFADCLAGSDVFDPPPGCNPGDFINADLDGDGDVDLTDFARFQEVFTGP